VQSDTLAWPTKDPIAKWPNKEDNCCMTVAAIAAALGGETTLARTIEYPVELNQLTREGLPIEALTSLAKELSLDRKTIARITGIGERTLNRRIASHERLTAQESDRTVRLARVVATATDTLGTAAKASLWLQTPNRALDGAIPLEQLDTDTGTHSVLTILGRIAYGIYS